MKPVAWNLPAAAALLLWCTFNHNTSRNGSGNGNGNGNAFMMIAQAQTIGDYIERNDDFNTLEFLFDTVTTAIIDDYYKDVEIEDTLFAPNNEAFNKFNPDFFRQMASPPFFRHLDNILLMHSSSETNLRAEDIIDGTIVKMDNDEDLTFSKSQNGSITINPGNVAVITPNVNVSNGVVHVVNSLLLPRWVSTNVIDVIEQFPEQFSTFIALMQRSELVERVTSNSVTMLVPTNDAFATAFAADPTLEQALDDTIFASTFVAYYVLPDILFEFFLDMVPPAFPTFLFGQTISITTERVTDELGSDRVVATFDGTAKYRTELLANNGVVGVIDSVLNAPTTIEVLLGQGGPFDTLLELFMQTELADTLATSRFYTLFAPNEGAFAKLSESLLTRLATGAFKAHLNDLILYHVYFDGLVPLDSIINGATLQVANMRQLAFQVHGNGEIIINGNVRVVEADLTAYGNPATIHTIDTVFIPPWIGFNVLDIAPTIGNFALFAQLVDRSPTSKALLTRNGPITVFLIPDKALLRAEAENPGLTDYLESDVEVVISVLNAHVVPGIVLSSDMINGIAVRSIGGDDLVFRTRGGVATVNDVTIEQTDVLTENGVVHVLGDGLIKPDGFELPTNAPAPTMEPRKSAGYSRGIGSGLMLSSVSSIMTSFVAMGLMAH